MDHTLDATMEDTVPSFKDYDTSLRKAYSSPDMKESVCWSTEKPLARRSSAKQRGAMLRAKALGLGDAPAKSLIYF